MGLAAHTRKDFSSRRTLQWPNAVTRPARARARAILRTMNLLLLHLRWKSGLQTCDSGHGLQRRFFYSFAAFAKLRMSGREPHMQNDSGANGNCRGR